ncbi:Rv3654c family TadE-like protein [Micromonospora narathiwatensis]|uniref:Helicase/secretion neighborhood TadE-like protein n=1 Tax=Micromonospora narathiwatensis TaxID=299146 RepID=A0A1A9ACY2_9ACTN|nr:Rv3654c family TadE-like protein [Micromonospora narathiwatensis]SBT54023.1 helicase/secretion neighborhood TadE-like protein [Micromonospora narathiwatensis]
MAVSRDRRPARTTRWRYGRQIGDGGRPATDRGGATVCLLAVGLVFVLVGLFGAALGAARTARQQARNAADFGALAGAGRALDSEDVACGRADELARANGGRLVACRLDGLDVVVTAEVRVAPLPGLVRTATATARAGPVRG